MKNLILIAPPAAGKGTQAEMLVKEYNYKHISTGDLFRKEVSTGSELGKELSQTMSSGKLVNDDVTNRLLKQELSSLDKNDNFILDGYPRTIEQAETLEEMIKELGINDYIVIFLEVLKETAMKRSTGRLLCKGCNSIYHEYNEGSKPINEGICDKCGAELYKRVDDNEESFNKRFDTYMTNTRPVIDYYKDKVKLETIESLESKEDTLKLMLDIIK